MAIEIVRKFPVKMHSVDLSRVFCKRKNQRVIIKSHKNDGPPNITNDYIE